MYKTLAVNSFNVQTPRPVTIELRPFFQVRMRRKHVVDVQRWPTSPYDLCCACAESIIHARRSKMADVNRTTCASSASSRLCPHCDRWLSRTAFNEHRALYFHKDTSSWKREAPCRSDVRWLLRKQQLPFSYLANHAQDIIYDGYILIIGQNNHSHS